MNEYEKQANDFLEKTGTEIETVFIENGKHFPDDKDSRDIYQVTLKRGNRSYSFRSGNQSTALVSIGIMAIIKTAWRKVFPLCLGVNGKGIETLPSRLLMTCLLVCKNTTQTLLKTSALILTMMLTAGKRKKHIMP